MGICRCYSVRGNLTRVVGSPIVVADKDAVAYDRKTASTFTGKERDEETGYGYFGARYMDHELMTMWLSVDPMADKYPGISPYAYCAWNPVKLVDPDGMDEWEVSASGKVRKVSENTDNDVFYSLNKQGERVNSIKFDYKTIEKLSSGKGSDYNYQVIRVRGDENGQNLFEFLTDPNNYELSENQNVEWSRILAGQAGKRGLNFLTTSWDNDKEAGSKTLFLKQLKYGYTIRGFDHNHPNNNASPSGTGGEGGDIQFIKMLRREGVNFTPNARFRIYTPGNKIKYNKYDVNSKTKLKPVIITG